MKIPTVKTDAETIARRSEIAKMTLRIIATAKSNQDPQSLIADVEGKPTIGKRFPFARANRFY